MEACSGFPMATEEFLGQQSGVNVHESVCRRPGIGTSSQRLGMDLGFTSL